MTTPNNMLGIILSGGAGKRVGGRDKGLIELDSKPLVQHVLERLAPQVTETVICIHRNEDRYARFGVSLVLDESIAYEGPMAGIRAALKRFVESDKQSEFEYFAVSPCDVPSLEGRHVERLLAAMIESDSDCAVAHDGNRRQNLHCLFQRRVVESLIAFYDQGGRAMHRWFEEVQCTDVDFSDRADCFQNLNRTDQFTQSD